MEDITADSDFSFLIQADFVPKGAASEFPVTSLNFDNRAQLDAVVKLYRETAQVGYPFPEVYDEEFWLSLHNPEDDESFQPFSSLGILHKTKLIAHLAVRRNQEFHTAEMLFPIVHPDYRAHIFSLSKSLWNALLSQALQQKLHFILHYALAANPLCQVMAAKSFHSTEVGIIPSLPRNVPAKLRSFKRPTERTSLLLLCNALPAAREKSRVIFPAKRHAEQVFKLFDILGLKRSSALPASVNIRSLRTKISAQQQAPFEVLVLSGGVRSLRLNSLEQISLASLGRFIEHARKQQEHFCIQIPLSSPHCPRFCESMEDAGFHFCGIFPGSAGPDYIVFAEYDAEALNSMALYSSPARDLRLYLMEQLAIRKRSLRHAS